MEQNSFLVVQWLPLCSSNAGGSDLIPGMGPTSMKFYFYFCFIDYTKAFDSVGHNKLCKMLKEMGIPDHLICLLISLYAGQEAPVRTDMEQQTGSKQEKEYVKAVYCHLVYLTYM